MMCCFIDFFKSHASMSNWDAWPSYFHLTFELISLYVMHMFTEKKSSGVFIHA